MGMKKSSIYYFLSTLMLTLLERKEFFYIIYNSPLHVAVKFGHIDVAGFLIDRGASVNKANLVIYFFLMMVFFFTLHQTPLHIAARMGNKAIVDLLIKKGAKLKKVDNNDEIPLFIAIRACNVEVVDKLLAGFNMETTNRKRQTALHLACISGSTEISRKLVDSNADLNARDIYGNTPLHYATMSDCGEVVNILLIHKADATLRNAKGKSPFFYASVEGAKLFRQHFQADGALDNLANAVQKQNGTLPQTPKPRRVQRTHPSNYNQTPQSKNMNNFSQDNLETSGSMLSPAKESDNPADRRDRSRSPSPSPKCNRAQQFQDAPAKPQQSYVTAEELAQFKTEMRQEIDVLKQKMNQMLKEIKQQIMESRIPQSIQDVKNEE